MGDLLSLLRFSAGTGHIWLDEQRMLLLHSRAVAELRKELLESLGVQRARGLLVRMGFASGRRDGELAVKQLRAGMRGGVDGRHTCEGRSEEQADSRRTRLQVEAEQVLEVGQAVVAAEAHLVAEEGEQQRISQCLRDDRQVNA
ncbi:MAG: XylR N-terminal domain-containing protein, partial [Pseudomonadota bacterium]